MQSAYFSVGKETESRCLANYLRWLTSDRLIELRGFSPNYFLGGIKQWTISILRIKSKIFLRCTWWWTYWRPSSTALAFICRKKWSKAMEHICQYHCKRIPWWIDSWCQVICRTKHSIMTGHFALTWQKPSHVGPYIDWWQQIRFNNSPLGYAAARSSAHHPVWRRWKCSRLEAKFDQIPNQKAAASYQDCLTMLTWALTTQKFKLVRIAALDDDRSRNSN